jgi:hypothetical protein
VTVGPADEPALVALALDAARAASQIVSAKRVPSRRL